MEAKLRFVIARHDCINGQNITGHYTIEAECPELAEALTRGGYGEGAHELHELVGVEVVES